MSRISGAEANSTLRIVRAIWHNPRISRVDIAARTGLDKSTVTNRVSRLIELGMVREIAEGSAGLKGGRKPIHLAINPSYGRTIGLEVQVESYTAVVTDLSGEVLGETKGRTRIGPGDFSAVVLGIIEESIGKLCPDPSLLLGIGVGTGGLVDQKKGRIRYSVPLGIDAPIDFVKAVSPSLPVPCYLENDANCCAWGELVFNKDEALRDFLFALVEFRKDRTSLGCYGGLGVGFGIVLGGKVYAGAHGNAGEFRSAFCEGRGDLQFSLPKEVLSRIDEDPQALASATEELARNMAMMLNTMDFERVYVGGDIESLGLDFPAVLRRRLEENWMYPVPKDVEIRFSSLGGRAVAYGAAGLVLDRLLSGHGFPGLLGRGA